MRTNIANAVEPTDPEDMLLGAEEALRAGDLDAARGFADSFLVWVGRGGSPTGIQWTWLKSVESALGVASV